MPAPEHDADLVIIGTGQSGLSALFVALDYLPPKTRISLVDRRAGYGGQWRDQYAHVRLHQPYRQFTAYNQKWRLNKPLDYLATRDEIVEHFEDLGGRAANRCALTTYFGYHFEGHTVQTGGALSISLRRLGSVAGDRPDAQSDVRVVLAKQMVFAIGLDVPILKPLPLSSSTIRSIAPTELNPLVQSLTASRQSCHFFFVGSGKTAMDSVLYVSRARPNDKISVVTGNGMMAFACRETYFPRGTFGRYFKSRTIQSFLVEYALRWNGSNGEYLFRQMLKRRLLIAASSKANEYRFGALGLGELAEVKEAVSEWIPGRLQNVVEEGGSTMLVFSDGSKYTMPLRDDCNVVIVNCTGHLFNQRGRPMLQCGGKVLDPQTPLLFPGSSATMVTHSWFRGRLPDIAPRLIRGDVVEDCDGLKPNEPFRKMLTLVYNFVVLAEKLPIAVLFKDQSNPSLYLPFLSQVKAGMMMKMNEKRILEHGQQMLGNVTYPVQ